MAQIEDAARNSLRSVVNNQCFILSLDKQLLLLISDGCFEAKEGPLALSQMLKHSDTF